MHTKHAKIPKTSWNIRFSWPHLHVQEHALHIHIGRYFFGQLDISKHRYHLLLICSTNWIRLKMRKKRKKKFSPSRAASLGGGWTKKAYSEGREGTPGLGIALCSKIRLPLTAHLPQDRNSSLLPILLTQSLTWYILLSANRRTVTFQLVIPTASSLVLFPLP